MTTILAGALLDLGLAMTLSDGMGVSLTLAAAVSFSAAILFNYALFEFWVFPRNSVRFSGKRLAMTTGSALVVLGVRLGVIELLSFVPRASLFDLIRLVAAMGISLFVNFLLIRKIFRQA